MTRKIRPIRIEGNTAYVPLTRGYEAVIDTSDVPLVEGWNWAAHVDKRTDGTVRAVYAFRKETCGDSKRRKVNLHRVIALAPNGMEVDHINGDGLNNLRSNLRIATRSENQHNGRARLDNTSGAKGVSWSKAAGKWRARIMLDGKMRYLGLFADINDAAAAYARASDELHGEFGRTA